MTLIPVDELARRTGSDDLRVVDVRWYLNRPGAGRIAYESGHLPGAIFLDLDTDLSATSGPGRHPLPEPSTFARRLAEAGIGDEHLVVAYDDAGGTVAARLWWMLDNLGHRRVALLDGGLQAWTDAGQSLTRQVLRWPPATLNLAERWTRVIPREELIRRLEAVTLLDGRAPERYRGEVEPVDPAAGHIPTARNLPVTGNLRADGRLLSPDQLRARFGALPAGQEIVTSCGSGTNACHHALAMRLAGLPDPILYVGSFSDWSRSGLPVVTGPEPGSSPDLDAGPAPSVL